MKQLLHMIWQRDKKNFLLLIFLNAGVALMNSISIVMLVPMLDLLEIPVGEGGTLQRLLGSFAGFTYLQRAVMIISIFVLLLLTRAFLSRTATVRENKFLETYERDLRSRLYAAVRSADWEILSEKSYAKLINLFTGQCRQARLCVSGIIALIASFVSAAMQLAIACWMSLPVTAIVLMVGFTFLTVFRPFLLKSREYGKKAVEITRSMHQEMQNQLNSIKEIRAYGVEESHAELFADISQLYYDTSLRTTQLRVTPQFCYAVAAAVLVALAFIVSVLFLDTGTAQLVILVYVFSRLWPVFSSWQGQLQNINTYLPAYETIQTAVQELSAGRQEPTQKKGILPFEKEVAFDSVCFTYRNGEEEVLTNASFTLPYGSVTALVGPSGAGKSTTADLLLGLLHPTSGHISVDGRPLEQEEYAMWRNAIGYIPQEPLILNATVRENLRRFHPEATEADMVDALKQSLAWPFVERLPEGMDTVLGDKGYRLSGGERQRIVLARVLIGKPRLIILDEATSALDYESETFIREVIRSLHGKTTVLVIAHRLATIRGAERAVVLENGRIAEEGPMSELLAREDGYLSRMVSVE